MEMKIVVDLIKTDIPGYCLKKFRCPLLKLSHASDSFNN